MKKTAHTLRFAAAMAVLLLAGHTLSAQTWKKVNGPFLYVHTLFFPKDNPAAMAVASDSIPTDEVGESLFFPFGDGYVMSLDSGKTFSEPRLNELSVRSFVQIPNRPEQWLAAVHETSVGGVVTSYDNGQTWQETFFPRCNMEHFMSLAVSNGPTMRFLGAAVGGGVIVSTDTFLTCNRVFNTAPIRDIAVSPLNPDLAFAAAAGPPYGGVYLSNDAGATWTQDSAHNLRHLRVLSILPSSQNASIVFCSADSVLPLGGGRVGTGIYRSTDGGKTWQFAGAAGSRVYSIVEHPRQPRILIAAGDSNGVWISGNWGKDWEQLNSGLPAGSRVRVVGFPNWQPVDDKPIAFAGLLGGGLYKSEPIATSVAENDDPFPSPSIEPNFPNPFDKSTAFYWTNPQTQPVRISINDMFGKEVGVLQDSIVEKGRHYMEWNAEKSPAGVYMLTIKAGTKTVQQKLMVVR